MRGYEWIVKGIYLGLAVFLGITFWKAFLLYQTYPSPEVKTYTREETIQFGNYEISFEGCQWDDGTQIRNNFPEHEFFLRQIDGREEELRVGIIELGIKKVKEEEDSFAIANIAFSSGAWGNQFDMELYYLLNQELGTMLLELPVGESQKVKLPLELRESHFTEAQWEKIDSRQFYIDFQYYPKHVRFELK